MPSTLPPELERLIFETAAVRDTDHDSRVKILLVAKRVYEWIRPIHDRVVIVDVAPDGTIAIRNRRSARLTDIAPFARHLLVASRVILDEYHPDSQITKLLSTFRNVENIAIWIKHLITPQVLEGMNGLPLRMLSVGPAGMQLDQMVKDCQPALRNITHLEISDIMESTSNDFMELREFPNLTHLCFHLDVEDEVLLGLLQHCPSLQAMIWNGIWNGDNITDDPRFLVLEDYKHFRLVEFIGQWEMSANGRIGVWEVVDMIIAARKGQLFIDNSSFIFFRETWMNDLNEEGRRWYFERCG